MSDANDSREDSREERVRKLGEIVFALEILYDGMLDGDDCEECDDPEDWLARVGIRKEGKRTIIRTLRMIHFMELNGYDLETEYQRIARKNISKYAPLRDPWLQLEPFLESVAGVDPGSVPVDQDPFWERNVIFKKIRAGEDVTIDVVEYIRRHQEVSSEAALRIYADLLDQFSIGNFERLKKRYYRSKKG